MFDSDGNPVPSPFDSIPKGFWWAIVTFMVRGLYLALVKREAGWRLCVVFGALFATDCMRQTSCVPAVVPCNVRMGWNRQHCVLSCLQPAGKMQLPAPWRTQSLTSSF